MKLEKYEPIVKKIVSGSEGNYILYMDGTKVKLTDQQWKQELSRHLKPKSSVHTGQDINPIVIVSGYAKIHHLRHPITMERLASIVRYSGKWHEIQGKNGTELYSLEGFFQREDAVAYFLKVLGYNYCPDISSEEGEQKKRVRISKDNFGFKVDSVKHKFGKMLMRKGGCTQKEIVAAKWNKTNHKFRKTFRKLMDSGMATVNDDGKMEATRKARNRS